jgi:hypothetical protein
MFMQNSACSAFNLQGLAVFCMEIPAWGLFLHPRSVKEYDGK